MSILAGDPLTQLAFSMHENKGVFALLIGSGVSRSADIPTGWEITLDLVRRVANAQGVDEQSDWAAWYQETTGNEPDYSALLEDLARTPEERRSILHGYIEPTDVERDEGKKVPTKAHNAIARLVRDGYVRVIVTTNFDRLLENALREIGVEPTIVGSPDALAGAEPISHSACYILKLHGDYKDARILNTDQELSRYPAEYDSLLDRIFDDFGLVAIGWSGEWDHALRNAILRAPNRRYPMFWATRGDPKDGANQIISQRDATLLPINTADEFLSEVADRVETLATTRKQNPVSVELQVNGAKRYLSRPENRISLDELFAAECERTVSRIEAEEFSTSGTFDADVLRLRSGVYESYAEALARMLGVLGRWGDQQSHDLALDIIKSMHERTVDVRGGNTYLLALRAYPTVLLFTAYGLGLTRAKRWDALHQLFLEPMPSTQDEPPSFVQELFLWSWEAGNNQIWQLYEGLERRKTALSDHLFDLFSEWSGSFVGAVPSFEDLFGLFEILASLAFIERDSFEGLSASLEADVNQGYIYTPVGRNGWSSSTKNRLLRQIEQTQLTEDLLAAGFSHGNSDYLRLAIVNYRRASSSLER